MTKSTSLCPFAILLLAVLGCSDVHDAPVTQPNEEESRVSAVQSPAEGEKASGITFLKPTVDSSISIVFHTHWNDSNGNRTVNSKEELVTELEGVTTVFPIRNNVCIALFVLGLNGAELNFDVIASSGERLLTDRVPIASDGVFAYREIATKEMPGPGVYVCRWFLNGEIIRSTSFEVVAADK